MFHRTAKTDSKTSGTSSKPSTGMLQPRAAVNLQRLQRSLGNQGMQRLLSRGQAQAVRSSAARALQRTLTDARTAVRRPARTDPGTWQGEGPDSLLIQTHEQAAGDGAVRVPVHASTLLRTPLAADTQPGGAQTASATKNPKRIVIGFRPPKVSLPDTVAGATSSAPGWIVNYGQDPVGLEDLTKDNPAFQVKLLDSNVIPAGGVARVEVGFAPHAPGDFRGTVVAETLGGAPAVLSVEGKALPAKQSLEHPFSLEPPHPLEFDAPEPIVTDKVFGPEYRPPLIPPHLVSGAISSVQNAAGKVESGIRSALGTKQVPPPQETAAEPAPPPFVPEVMPSVQELPAFNAKNWAQARALLLRAKPALGSLSAVYTRQVESERQAAWSFVQSYAASIQQFQAKVGALLTEETVARLRSLTPDNDLTNIALELDIITVPLGTRDYGLTGLIKDIIFAILSHRETAETKAQIEKGIAASREFGLAASGSVGRETALAINLMALDFSKLTSLEQAMQDIIARTPAQTKWIDQLLTLANDPNFVKEFPFSQAKPPYDDAGSTIEAFLAKSKAAGGALRDLVLANHEIAGQLDAAYARLDGYINPRKGKPSVAANSPDGPGKAAKLELVLEASGASAAEVRELLEWNDFQVVSFTVINDAMNRRQISADLQWRGTKGLSAEGYLLILGERIRKLKGLVVANTTGLHEL